MPPGDPPRPDLIVPSLFSFLPAAHAPASPAAPSRAATRRTATLYVSWRRSIVHLLRHCEPHCGIPLIQSTQSTAPRLRQPRHRQLFRHSPPLYSGELLRCGPRQLRLIGERPGKPLHRSGHWSHLLATGARLELDSSCGKAPARRDLMRSTVSGCCSLIPTARADAGEITDRPGNRRDTPPRRCRDPFAITSGRPRLGMSMLASIAGRYRPGSR